MAKAKRASGVLSERIRMAWQDSNRSGEDLSLAMGFASRNQVSNWANGHSRPDPEDLAKFADLTGVTIDWLAGRTDNRRGTAVVVERPSRRLEELMEALQAEIGRVPAAPYDLMSPAPGLSLSGLRMDEETAGRLWRALAAQAAMLLLPPSQAPDALARLTEQWAKSSATDESRPEVANVPKSREDGFRPYANPYVHPGDDVTPGVRSEGPKASPAEATDGGGERTGDPGTAVVPQPSMEPNREAGVARGNRRRRGGGGAGI